MLQDKIGAKVYPFRKAGDYSWTLDKSTLYTIVEVKNNPEKAWLVEVTIESESGKREVIEDEYFVFAPNTDLSEIEMIQKYLSDNGIYADCINENAYTIAVEIPWGDWKHDHIWCDNLMGYIGYGTASEELVTEENGSDCYSAIHYFSKLK